MLQIKINNQPIDTAGVSFNLTLKSPVFQNTMDSPYVYDVQLPPTDNNKKHLLNFTNRLQSINQPGQPVIQAFFNGIKLFEGPFIYSG